MKSPRAIEWRYLHDSTFSRFDGDTLYWRVTDGRTDTRRQHVPR